MNYTISSHAFDDKNHRGAMVDRGANGGLAGSDVRPFHQHIRQVNVTGIARNGLRGLPMVDCAAKAFSNHGEVIIIMLQHALYGKDRTIHSSGQLEHHGLMVNGKSMKVSGRQCIRTPDGYIFPLDIENWPSLPQDGKAY